MLIPRTITFMLVAFCATIAVLLSLHVLIIPYVTLHYLVVAAAAFFGLTGVVMFVGTFGMYRTPNEIKIYEGTRLGKLMRRINKNDRREELHCCDISINTGKWVGIRLLALLALMGVVFLEYADFLFLPKLLGAVLCVILAFVTLSYLIPYMGPMIDRMHDVIANCLKKINFKQMQILHTISVWILNVIFCVAVIGAICMLAYYSVVYPVQEMMMLGCSFFAALGIYSLSVSMIGLPLFCIGGKKLIAKTAFAKDYCPPVSRW